MTERPAVALSPLHLARARKCDRDVKLHLPEALYDDLAQVARADRRPVSEYVRVLLEQHLYGALGARRG